ncbi:hypothetical protein NDU88_001250 [Pleurodeles waltl]|uniref:Uncharacterized protein n=1 Tax=Pleurodeles waltl TaxID=8319 RepID=A0AAV7KNZ5_PLEWA|nr:hypothetical protein NDU88_001250 [Pleurodeles waltl]
MSLGVGSTSGWWTTLGDTSLGNGKSFGGRAGGCGGDGIENSHSHNSVLGDGVPVGINGVNVFTDVEINGVDANGGKSDILGVVVSSVIIVNVDDGVVADGGDVDYIVIVDRINVDNDLLTAVVKDGISVNEEGLF